METRHIACVGLPGVRFFWGNLSGWKFQLERTQIYRYLHMYPEPQFLAPAQNLEIGQESRFFDVPTWQPYAFALRIASNSWVS